MALKSENEKSRFGILPKLLMVLMLVSLLPLLVIWYLNYQTTMQHVTETAHKRVEAVNNALVVRINDWMEMNSRMLRENAAESAIRSMDTQKQRPELRLIKKEYPWIHSVLVMTPDGNSISRADDKPLKNYSDRDYVKQVLAGEPLGQQVLIGKTTGIPGLALAVPIQGGDGAVEGILTISMATAVLSAYVTNIRVGDTGFAFLLDAEGKVIAHQSMQDSTFRKDFSRHPAFLALTREGQTSVEYRDQETNRRVVAYMKRTDADWILVTHQDYDEAFSTVSSTNRNAVFTLIITLSVALITALILSRRLTQPLRQLTRVANEVSLANFTAMQGDLPGKDRSDEIGELARSVERLAVSLRVAIGRLQKSGPG